MCNIEKLEYVLHDAFLNFAIFAVCPDVVVNRPKHAGMDLDNGFNGFKLSLRLLTKN